MLKTLGFFAFVFWGIAFLTSCSSVIPSARPYHLDIPQGNVVDGKMLAQLRHGMNKSQVRYVLGTPLLQDSFHPNRWDYLYQLMRDGKVIERRRVILEFDGDLLKSVRGDTATVNESNDLSTEKQSPGSEQEKVTKINSQENIEVNRKEKGSWLSKLKFWERPSEKITETSAKSEADVKSTALEPLKEVQENHEEDSANQEKTKPGTADSLRLGNTPLQDDLKEKEIQSTGPDVNINNATPENPSVGNDKNKQDVTVQSPTDETENKNDSLNKSTKPWWNKLKFWNKDQEINSSNKEKEIEQKNVTEKSVENHSQNYPESFEKLAQPKNDDTVPNESATKAMEEPNYSVGEEVEKRSWFNKLKFWKKENYSSHTNKSPDRQSKENNSAGKNSKSSVDDSQKDSLKDAPQSPKLIKHGNITGAEKSDQMDIQKPSDALQKKLESSSPAGEVSALSWTERLKFWRKRNGEKLPSTSDTKPNTEENSERKQEEELKTQEEITKSKPPIEPDALKGDMPLIKNLDKEIIKAINNTEKHGSEQTNTSSVVKQDEKEVLKTHLFEWISAWQNKKLHNYLAFYADVFKPQEGTKEAWKKQRAYRLSAKQGTTSIFLENIIITLREDSATTTFVQHYQSDRYMDVSHKTLTWIKVDGVWNIVRERSVLLLK